MAAILFKSMCECHIWQCRTPQRVTAHEDKPIDFSRFPDRESTGSNQDHDLVGAICKIYYCQKQVVLGENECLKANIIQRQETGVDFATLEFKNAMLGIHHNTHDRHPIAHPWGWAMGCLLWVQTLIYTVPLSPLCHVEHNVILYIPHITLINTITHMNLENIGVHNEYDDINPSASILEVQIINFKTFSKL